MPGHQSAMLKTRQEKAICNCDPSLSLGGEIKLLLPQSLCASLINNSAISAASHTVLFVIGLGKVRFSPETPTPVANILLALVIILRYL